MRLAFAGAFLLAGAAQAEVPQVVADIAPIHALVARVMQGVGEPALLVEPGASPHGYALRPSRAAALDRAQAVFWMGEGLEPWLEGPLETLGDKATVVELLQVPGTTVLEFREGATFEAHEHEAEGGSHADEHGHDEHGHEEGDPHAWLDPMNAWVWLGAIADTLGQIDPDNAARYAANAAEGRAELDALTAELTATLADVAGLKFIVFHDAFHYFENRFGLSAAGAISLSDASDPSARRIAEIRQTVTQMNVTCVFTEPQFNPGLINTVTEAGVNVATLDPLGANHQAGWPLYAQMLRDLAESIRDCQ